MYLNTLSTVRFEQYEKFKLYYTVFVFSNFNRRLSCGKFLLKYREYELWLKSILQNQLRVSDIVGLNVSDVVDKTHIIIEKKTQKRKFFNINNKLKCVLKPFIKDRDFDEPLFLGKQGKILNQRQVYRFLTITCQALGIKAKVSTHTMRRTFGYHHYQQYKYHILIIILNDNFIV